MNIAYEHKPAMTFIGYSTSIRPEEGYTKCPEFWDKEYVQKYARLWQTIQPEAPLEKAILENGVGLFAICDEKEDSFEYWIAGLYKGGEVPEGLKLYTFPENDWAMFSAKGPLPGSLQALNTRAGVVSEGRAEIPWQRQRHAGGVLSRRYAKPGLRMRHLGSDLQAPEAKREGNC